MKKKMKHLKNAFLSTLMIALLSGCESMPIAPKRPDPCPRVPINKGVPPELSQGQCLSQGERE